MTVTQTKLDKDALTMTITAEFDAPVAAVWQMWANPRLLERWWGPPTYPATMTEHDLSPGGTVTYFMTSPEGEKHHGWWRVRSVEAPEGLSFEDGFGDAAGRPNLDMPVTTTTVHFDAQASRRTRMVIMTTFASLANMEQVIAMGMEEGMSLALGQIDALLAKA